jgi:2-polyprenyl-6-hydroxyphenyl methylase/3-demethylubiquinone-9 3-methyltransferase
VGEIVRYGDSMKTSSVDQTEISHFAKDSSHWWDENGPFKPLHRLNPTRIRFIREQITPHDLTSLRPFEGLSIVDVGCGGGLVCESLARLGANVTGIDADANAIKVAKNHALAQDFDIDYSCMAAEDLESGPFDVVCALEIVEHVADIESFVQSLVRLCKPGGIIIMSTLNKTAKSYLLGIVAAEHILRWVPQGTHQWQKFVKPSQLSRALRIAGADVEVVKGLIYNPVRDEFLISNTDIDVNYLVKAVKR